MHTYIQVIYDIDTCFITVSFRCHVVYWSIVIIRHGFSGALHWACSHFWMMFHCSTIFQMNFLLSRVLSIQQNLADLAYIYIPLEHPSFFFRKQGYSDWTHGNFPVGHRIVQSAGWIPIAECSPETRRRAAILILQVRKGGEMLKSSWILGTLVGEMLRLYLQE